MIDRLTRALEGSGSNRTCGFPCIRLSDKTSRLRPRHVAPKPGQTHEPACRAKRPSESPRRSIMAETETLYDDDILLWSEQQAELLRRRAANALDWDNLAEEIGDVGLSQLRAVEAHLILALLHDLKAEAWPLARDVEHWRAEARGHRDDARRHFSPSMAQRIDTAKLYRQALRRMPETLDGTHPLPMPATCPVTLAEMLSEGAD
jgi:hypothetical protein